MKDWLVRNDFDKDRLLIAMFVIVFVVISGFVLADIGTDIEIDNNRGLLEKFNVPIKTLSTAQCEEPDTRALAVMLSSDLVARPLSGISQADFVFEMPVTQSGVTRMMAVYQCEYPDEMGSIRSARLDFLPLVQGLGAIYAHWGGEATALGELNKGILDNINGLIYDGSVYFRKSGIPRPHDGFSTTTRLFGKAKQLDYDTDYVELGYTYDLNVDEDDIGTALGTPNPVSVFTEDYQVNWEYEQETNTYLRFRGDSRERDRNTNTAVRVSNVVIMDVGWTPINQDYIRVHTTGRGLMTLYKNGKSYSGTWEKENVDDRLVFKNINEKEILFTYGKVWIEMDAGI